MILVTTGVVLSRRRHQEFDRVAVVYTRALGRVSLRFAGVDRPRGKMKALSEPMVRAEYRLYCRPGSAWFTVTGGHILDSHPDLRSSLDRTLAGLEMCELLMRLTPEASPSAEKYELIAGHLEALDDAPSPWLTVAFGLRLLALAGLGPDPSYAAPADSSLWDFLQRADPARLRELPEDPDRFSRLRSALGRIAERHIEAPLNSRLLRESMASSRLAPV